MGDGYFSVLVSCTSLRIFFEILCNRQAKGEEEDEEEKERKGEGELERRRSEQRGGERSRWEGSTGERKGGDK